MIHNACCDLTKQRGSAMRMSTTKQQNVLHFRFVFVFGGRWRDCENLVFDLGILSRLM